MSKVLQLYNTFTRNLKEVKLSGKLITPNNVTSEPINASFYICGPTVYSDCHVGHALTYIRADLFRRFLKSMFNVRLNTVMNITDIDDKILERTSQLEKTELNLSVNPSSHSFNKISDKYYRAFLKDLELINVLPADMYIKVSKHIHLITNFIGKLEKNGNAYIAQNGDVYFKVESVKNYIGRTDNRPDANQVESAHTATPSNAFKHDKRDFVLWKAAKPNEPIWHYYSTTSDKCIPGRPGWHVQCSAIAGGLFGKELDFHFGGKDLIFPHHYNEEACSCAFHQLDTSQTLHVWANNWLHSGHLILKDNLKMSKSVGNVVAINNFISRSSVNALRLLCVATHYRTDVTFSDDLLNYIKSLDHKINAFNSFLHEELRNKQDTVYGEDDCDDLKEAIMKTNQDIVEGVCDDFHLERGLESIINLSKVLYSKPVNKLNPRDMIIIWSLLQNWYSTCGLSYGLSSDSSIGNIEESSSLELLVEFRNKVREWTLSELKKTNNSCDKNSLTTLINECDTIRSRMIELGLVTRDLKSK